MIKCVCGYLKDKEELRSSTSGGLASAIARSVLKSGGVVYGAQYDDDFRGAHYARVDSLSGMEKLRGTKYTRAKWNGVMEQIKEDLANGIAVAFIGLPCDAAAVKVAVGQVNGNANEVKLTTVDLICHGPTYDKVAEQYLDSLEKEFGAKTVGFSVRYKNPYWKPPYLWAKFENGKEFAKEFYATDYGKAFSIMSLEGCYSCRYKGENHQSDITIGDYWGVEENDAGYNIYGTSIAFVHSAEGEKILSRLEDFELFPADMEKALKGNPRYSISAEKTEAWHKFKNDFDKLGLHRAVQNTVPAKAKIYNMMPNWIQKLYKRLKG